MLLTIVVGLESVWKGVLLPCATFLKFLIVLCVTCNFL